MTVNPVYMCFVIWKKACYQVPQSILRDEPKEYVLFGSCKFIIRTVMVLQAVSQPPQYEHLCSYQWDQCQLLCS